MGSHIEARATAQAEWSAREDDDQMCDCCNYLTDCTPYRVPCQDPHEPEEFNMLCEVCASTFIGNAHNYPRQYENATLFKTIGFVANMLLDEIRKTK